MTLVERRTDNRIGAHTVAGLASVGLGTGIRVVTAGAVGLVGIGTYTRAGITGARFMTLIQGCTYDRVGAYTAARLAGVGLGASIAVITGRSVGLDWIRTDSSTGIANTCIVTLIERRTNHGIGSGTGARLASIGLSTQVAIVASRSIRLGGIRADPATRVADTNVVALTLGYANNRIGSAAATCLTGVGLGTQITIIAERPVDFGRVSTNSGARVAHSGYMTLIQR